MTKLGIKSNIMAVLMCVVGLVSGYVGALLMAGYILMYESDTSLRKVAIKVLTVMCMCSLVAELIGLIPDFVSWISSVLMIFGGSLYIGFLSSLCSVLTGAIWIAETIILGLMAVFAYKGKDFFTGKLDTVVSAINEGIDIETAFPKKEPQVQQNLVYTESSSFENNGFGYSGTESGGFEEGNFGSDQINVFE